MQARIHQLAGVVTRVSSDRSARTAARLEGRVDEFGAATIAGELAPFEPAMATDATVAFSNLTMSSLTPYTVKFAGRRIDDGKLSLDLGYKIAQGSLQGSNRLVINQLKLGEPVESPDAIDAPLDLAVALLQDSEGVINIDLPVTGDLNDPEFSYGPLIWKAFGNLLANIITAPFRALGAALGVEGDDLDRVVFAPGRSDLAPPEQEKLQRVGEILAKRPKLVLEVAGGYLQAVDGEALRRHDLTLALGKQLGVEVAEGERPDPLSLTDERTREALQALFVERFGADALAALQPSKAVKQGPAGQGTGNSAAAAGAAAVDSLHDRLHARLLEQQPLAQARLQQLAADRAAAVATELTARAPALQPRIRIGEPGPLEPATTQEVALLLGLAPQP